ncbi:MAG: hypothetical protein HON43_02155 [Alphaproteobacteria bacterium]|jgi:myosin heavy subunit|nr:hypothetical protein [Alphaproteobacteria bacterium]MBT5389657.1 hypothetical protein [Alphaproteobacteria bacterium]
MASSSKHRARLLASSALISTYLFFADFAYAGAAIIPDAKSLPKGPKWAAQSFLDLKAGSQRNIGQIGLMGPVFQNDRSMLFADFRFMKDSRNNAEGNYGLGYRRIVGEWVYGGYGFFDHRETRFNNIFNQVTVGAEALSTTWEARANVYLPVSSKKLIRVEKPVPTGRDRFEGGTVLHEENLQMEKVDIPMGGLDLELGYQVLKGLRVYGAAYYFRASGAPTIRGGRIRVTYDINKYLALEGQAQRDNIRKNTYFAGVRLTVPLYDVDKAHKLTDVEKLMLRPVVRDIDIVEQAVDREVLVDKLIPTVPIEDVSIEEGAAHTNSSLVGVYNLQDPQIQRALLKKMPKVSAVFDVQEQKRVSARDIKKRIIGIRHDKAKSKRENESVQHLWKIWRWREDYAHRDDEATMSPERKLLLSQRELTSPSKSNSSARFGREPSIPPQNSSVRSRRDLHSEFERVKQDEQQKVHNSPISAADLVKKFEEFSSDNTRQINANSVVRESVTKTEVQETTLVVSVSPSVSTSSMSAELSSSQETKEHGGSQPLDGVVKVQSVARGYLSRKHQKQQSDLKKAVVLGHKLWRGKLAERAYQADRSDIVTVQSLTRGYLSRKHQKQQLDLKKAVVLGQKLWRGKLAERAYQADRSDIVTVQSLTRGNLARKHQKQQLDLKKAVVLGQKLWRGKLAERAYQADRSDIVTVQSLTRGNLARKHQKQQSDLKKAVVLGQKLWRGKLAERAYKSDRSDIVTVQSLTRGNLARKHQKQQLDLKKAVVLGQKLWRGRVAERAYQADRSDIVTVQSLTRGNLARKHQSELKEAVVLGQNLWREKVKARQTRADSSDVVTVQSLTRGYLIRKQQSELKKAVVLGQKLWRRKLAERAYKSDRSDIVKVQSLARGYLTRKDQKQQSDLKKAVVLGQNLWRGKLAERAYKADRSDIVTAQSFARGYLIRKQQSELKKAVVVGQQLWRGKLAERAYKSDRSDIVTAQSFARGYLIRKQQSELKKAVILGQKLWREKVRARQIRADRSSIVTVQSLARGYLARKRQSELKKAVVLGQKLWRGKTAASKLKAETGAASTIQRVFRDYEGRKEAAKLKKAAITIQNQWRKKVRARQTRADRSSIVTAQSLVRGYLARKRQLELKKAAIAVQKQWREKVRARQTLADRSDKESPTIVPPANELVVYSGNLNHSTSLDDSLTDVEFVSAHEIHNNYENLVEPEMMIRLGHSADSEIDQKKFTERKNSFLISRDRALEGISSLLDEHKNGVVEITNPHELGLKDFQLKHKGIEILERSSSKGVTKWTVANVEPKEKNENFPPLVTNSDSSRQPTTVLGIQGNEEESLIEKVLIPSQNLHPRAGDFAHLFEESDTDGPVLTELSGSVELSVNEESTKDRSALSSSQNEEGVAKKERIKVASLHPRAGDFAHLFEESDTDGPVLTELSNSLDSSVNEESTKERSVPTSSQNEEEVAKKERIKVASLHQRADEFAHLFEESDTDEPVLTELSSSVEMPANEESTEDRSALSSSQNEEGVANKENTSSPQKYPLNNGEVVKPFDNKPQLHPDAKKYAGKFGTNSGLHPDAKKYANEFGTNPGLHPNANEYADQFVETPKKEGLFARIGRRIFGGKRS